MRLTGEQFEKVKDAYDIVTMAEKVTPIHMVGEHVFKGKCPFCNDREESFGASGRQQIFYCFNCRRAGSVFDFYGYLYGFKNVNTIACLMAEEAGIELD